MLISFEAQNTRSDRNNATNQSPFRVIYNYRQLIAARRRKYLRKTLKQRKFRDRCDRNGIQSSSYGQQQQFVGEQERLWDIFESSDGLKNQLLHSSTDATIKAVEINSSQTKKSNLLHQVVEICGTSINKKQLFQQVFFPFSYPINS